MINCKKAQLLMVPMLAGTLGTTDEEKRSFQEHLIVCQACTKEYEETKRLMSFVEKHWGTAGTETRQLLEQADYKAPKQKHVSRPMTVEEGWKDLCIRCPELADTPKKSKTPSFLRRIGAAAACLAIGILTWMAFSNYSKPQTLPNAFPTQQLASAHKASVKVELLTNTGNVTIPDGKQITSANQLKTLLINGKHRMVMNLGTSLSIEPVLANAQLGCLVKLTSGEILAHVEHDGNPFIVDTAHGRAVITGTTFDIKAAEGGTTLVVTEGTVRFGSQKGVVNVTAGYTSNIIANSAPAKPAPCDTAKLTSWATAHNIKDALAGLKSTNLQNLEEIELIATSAPPDLDRLDYNQWVESNRNWFKREFPWIFKLKETLAGKDIDVDYPQLLIESGDIWQFVYPESSATQIPVFNDHALINIASRYNIDSQELIDVAGLSHYSKTISNRSLGINAFGAWSTDLEKTKLASAELNSRKALNSLHASVYLNKTRILAWLCVKNDIIEYSSSQKTKTLDLLQQHVELSHKNIQLSLQLITAGYTSCTIHYPDLLTEMMENINEMTAIEKGMGGKKLEH